MTYRQSSNPMPLKSSSTASDVSVAPFGLPVIRRMQSFAAHGKTAERVANHKPESGSADPPT
jgi:hypothetical protein